MFKYSLDNKRYHTLNYHFKNKYGKKVFKVSLNANFSCPNKINGKGCIFCSRLGSGDFAGNVNKDLITQFNEVKDIMKKKWPDAYYIAYFQANTNTFAPVSVLKEKYESVLNLPNVIGLDIATRPDSISEECLEYLKELNERTNLTVELGLQSMHEKTLKFIRRGHNLKQFEDCVKKLKDNNISVVVHIINGLPNETKEMMLETVKYLNKLNIDGIKIHMLHVIKDTDLGDLYLKEPFHILTKEEYIDIVVSQLELLKPEIVIHRITGDPKKEDLIEPTWLLKKFCVLNDIDKEMKRKNTYQGKYYNAS
jgi:radical SAM protein (TIGR01212 family)